jgi:integrase
MYSCVRALFSYAELGELIVRSPCRNIRVPESSPRKAQILDSHDLVRLAAAMGDTGLMIYLAALGPRWGEIAGLRVGKIDFLHSTIIIATQRTRGERGAMVEQDPKSMRGSRTFTAPEWIMDLLADHLAARSLTGADSQELVFVTPHGAPLHYSNWRRRLRVPASEFAGFSGLHFHDVRKTAATRVGRRRRRHQNRTDSSRSHRAGDVACLRPGHRAGRPCCRGKDRRSVSARAIDARWKPNQ